MTTISALVFDLDQTLFDRQRAFDDWVGSVDIASLDRARLRELDQNGYGDQQRFFEAFESRTGEVMTHPEFVRALTRFIQPDFSLNQLLQGLRASYEIAILTNGGVLSQQAKLHALHLQEVFPSNRVFISSQIGFTKPDPSAFRYVAGAIEIPNESCLYFGDQMETDVIASRRAGWFGCNVRCPRDLKRKLIRLREASKC